MKINRKDLNEVKKILPKINFDIEEMTLFFPIDLKIVETDEFGITKSQYKNESHYGSTLTTGIVPFLNENNETTANLGYCSTVNLFSFNLAEYLNLTQQPQSLTKEEINYISQFEVAIGPKKLIFKSLIPLL